MLSVCTLYVLHIRDSGKLLSTQFVKVDKASSPATSSKSTKTTDYTVFSYFFVYKK